MTVTVRLLYTVGASCVHGGWCIDSRPPDPGPLGYGPVSIHDFHIYVPSQNSINCEVIKF